MRLRAFFLVTLLFAALSVARADVVYQFSVNTSSISGTSGSLDFNFNPGSLASQSASHQILNFTSNGTLVPPAFPTGDVTGTLPATLAFDNGTAFNDYFEGFTYGSSLSFKVDLSGAAVNSPDGTSASGSTFAFSMYSDAAGTIPALTADTTNGFATLIDINLDGSTKVTNNSLETTIGSVTPVPEPSSLLMLGTGLVGALGAVRRRLLR